MPTHQNELEKLSENYLTALQGHVEEGPEVSHEKALELGGAAVALGLEPEDLTVIHDHAMKSLTSPDGAAMTTVELELRAATFFTTTLIPIESTPPVLPEAQLDEAEIPTVAQGDRYGHA